MMRNKKKSVEEYFIEENNDFCKIPNIHPLGKSWDAKHLDKFIKGSSYSREGSFLSISRLQIK